MQRSAQPIRRASIPSVAAIALGVRRVSLPEVTSSSLPYILDPLDSLNHRHDEYCVVHDLGNGSIR
jgi:hypothetical protein